MMDKNRDRGRIKWTAMMLTEHVQKLKEWMDEDHYEERPSLCEFDLQAIQEEIELGFKSKCQILIKTWDSGVIKNHQGIIVEIDLQLMLIILKVNTNTEKISVKDIISAQNIN